MTNGALRDAVLEELKRRSRGPGGLPPHFLQAIQALAVACAQAGFSGATPADLDPQAESALAQIEKLPPPLSELSPFLRRLAAGELPQVPSGLPAELRSFLTQLLDAARESGSGEKPL